MISPSEFLVTVYLPDGNSLIYRVLLLKIVSKTATPPVPTPLNNLICASPVPKSNFISPIPSSSSIPSASQTQPLSNPEIGSLSQP